MGSTRKITSNYRRRPIRCTRGSSLRGINEAYGARGGSVFISICLHTSPSDGHSARHGESRWGVEQFNAQGLAGRFKGSLCSLRYHLLPQWCMHEREEGKIPMRALNPRSSQTGSTCFTCQKLAFRGDGLGLKVRAWYLTIYFPR